MTHPVLVGLSALFLWWASTGLILWRVRRADLGRPEEHIWSVLLGLPLLIGGILGLTSTLGRTDVGGVFIAFVSGLAVWGWIELAFLSGIIAGPVRTDCPPGAVRWTRFLSATGTILWHELLLISALGLIFYISLGMPNRLGLWTFAVLFFARVSAKLNLFLGVPRIHTEFLPRTLHHLPSHFRIARMNWFFPISVTALSFSAACFIERAIAARSEAVEVGFVLLSALTLLALLEHWFMVLPLPDQKLWAWMLPDRPIRTPAAPAPPTPAKTG